MYKNFILSVDYLLHVFSYKKKFVSFYFGFLIRIKG